MKATEFVKKYGLDLVKRDVACLESGFITKADFMEHYGFEILDDLKRLVESYEIVELFGGAEQCKEDLNRLIANNVFEFEHRLVDNIKCTTERFKQAIADVEACQ